MSTFALALLFSPAQAPTPVIDSKSLLTAQIAGLERTNAVSSVFGTTGQPFGPARRVAIRGASQETNATQLTLPNISRVQQGDVILASMWLRSPSKAQIEFLFEKSTEPWTKSVTRGLSATPKWRQVFIPFRSSETYEPNQAMASLRFAFGPQTVEVADLRLDNYAKTKSLDELVDYATSKSPIGEVTVNFDFSKTAQTMLGFGGNFCQPRYGSTEPMDAVGTYNLRFLNVVHARIGLPLNHWSPEPGVYQDDAQARASLLTLAEMTRRKIPTVVSVWEGPSWMLGGRPEQTGRTLPADKYKDCIEAIARYLVLARDKYKAKVDYFSFNEPDYGVNFKFTSSQMIEFIRQAGARFYQLNLKTKFLVGDTANGSNFAPYARPILADKSIARYLGPLSFHSWDALSSTEESYKAIGELGRRYNKPVWCLEAGHDAGLWQKPNPWATWENALQTAMAYERTIRLTGATLMDYWTYQDNYPLVDKAGPSPYPVFVVMKQMESVFTRGNKVVVNRQPDLPLQAIATKGPKGSFALLLVNSHGSGVVKVKGLPKNKRMLVTENDAKSLGRRRNERVDARGTLTLKIPMRSVVSAVSRG